MQSVTLVIGILGSILVLLLRPVYALAVYFGVLVWYPEYLRVSIGTIDISVGRIVVTVLLLRCLCDEGLRRKFIWSKFDKLITLSMALYVGIYCITHPFFQAFENRGGFLIDTWFTYLAVRLILTDKRAIVSFIKTIAVILAPLAIYGLVESITHWQPFFQLTRFRTWRATVVEGIIAGERRWGLTRAIGPFSHFIMFGGCFALFLPLIWTLRHQRGYWRKLAYPLCGLAIIGAFSSMSSGPWSVLIVVLFCLVMERFKRWAKPLLITIVLWCIFVSAVSNRSFYQILYSHANLAGGNHWQRVRLIDAAIENFDEWWLAGYGGKDPGWHGTYFWGHFTDVNNEFIKMGIEYGILGLLAFCGVLAMAFYRLVRAGSQTKDKQLKSLYWSLGVALVGLIVMMQGVSIFGQMNALFYVILGITGASFGFAKHIEVGNGKTFGR